MHQLSDITFVATIWTIKLLVQFSYTKLQIFLNYNYYRNVDWVFLTVSHFFMPYCFTTERLYDQLLIDQKFKYEAWQTTANDNLAYLVVFQKDSKWTAWMVLLKFPIRLPLEKPGFGDSVLNWYCYFCIEHLTTSEDFPDMEFFKKYFQDMKHDCSML